MMGKVDLIARARARGCKAETYQGALRYLRKHCQKNPRFKAYEAGRRWDTRLERLDDYLAAQYTKRGTRIMEALGLKGWECVECGQRRRGADGKCDECFYGPHLKTMSRQLEAFWPHRRSKSRWAGGCHRVSIELADVGQAMGGSHRAWSRNGKWAGTNSWAFLRVTTRVLRWYPTLRLPDGNIVVDVVTPDYVLVVRQGPGFELWTEIGRYRERYRVVRDIADVPVEWREQFMRKQARKVAKRLLREKLNGGVLPREERT